jgi:hypothetical protein
MNLVEYDSEGQSYFISRERGMAKKRDAIDMIMVDARTCAALTQDGVCFFGIFTSALSRRLQ